MNESFGTLGERSVVRFERIFHHPQELVWRAITEPDELRHWFPSDVVMDYRVGGKVRFPFRDGEWPELEGRILELDPPHLFSFLWGDSVLRFELRPEAGADGPGCRLLFSHTFDDPVSAASFAAGWYLCFENLYLCLDGKVADVGLDQWAARHDRYVKEFGLDVGTVEDAGTPGGGWVVRFARQLTRPVDEVWQVVTEGRPLEVGGPVPAAFAGGDVVTLVEPPRLLEYRVAVAGGAPAEVRWELAPGNGGARLDLRETVPADRPDDCPRVMAKWATTLEALADTLRA